MQGLIVQLHDTAGNCPKGTSAATWIQAEGRVDGCWFVQHERVWLFWDDGDNHGAHLKAFGLRGA